MLAATDDPECLSVAERALGLSARELHDVGAARQHLLRAIGHAERAGLRQRAAEARLSLAVELVAQGRATAALRELGRASRDLIEDHPQILAQLAFVYTRLGHYEEAIASNTRALASAERLGDRSRVALVLANRGITYGYQGALANAEGDLRRAQGLCVELGERFGAVDAGHNLAWVLARAGRLPESLALYDEAEAGLAALGTALGVYRLDRAEALLAAGLVGEAAALARSAAEEFADTGHEAELPEALLLQSRAALLGGAHAASAAAAQDAATRFEEQDRHPWACVARAVELQALARAGSDVASAAAALVRELEQRGLRDDEHDVRLAGATAALLEPLAGLRRSRSSRTRARAWEAELRLRRDRGDRRGALSAADSALRALDDVRSGLGATDLHASAAVHGASIATTAIDIALDGPPAELLRWTERARATTLRHAPVRPPQDEQLAADLERLRLVAARRQQALLDGESPTALHHEQLDLEEAVRRRSRHAQARSRTASATGAAPVRRRLAGGRFVSLFAVRGRLHALRIAPRRSDVLDLCAEADVLTELRHLRLALRRAVLSQPGAADAVAAAGSRLDAMLGPALQGAGRLVIAPTPSLTALPWSVLESVADSDVELTPSAALWCREAPPRAGSARVAVAGPQLPQAEAEVRALAAGDPTIRVLSGDAAAASEVLSALDGAQLAHLACHGQFRAENPMFSSLLLADGPLTVYDIERLRSAPEHVVLSACDTARMGDELLGLAAAFLSLGTRTLVASVVSVDDAATKTLMVAMHAHWRAGSTAAAALRAAQRQHPGPTAAAFVCLTAAQAVEPSQTVSG